ncbi:MAG: hypothetical protein AB8I58_16305 [Anaerolineales bacterium]
MLIFLTALFLFLIALALIILSRVRPALRYTWLVAVGGALGGWISVLIWQFRLPVTFQLPGWEPANLFLESLSFTADTFTWLFAFSVATLVFAVILTASARENFPAPIPWAATLALGGLGLLAVLADNPLSLLMVWSAIDLVEVIAQLRSVDGPQPSEKVVTAFATRVAGSGVLLWANMVSISTGSPMNFQDAPPQVGLYLLLAAGLRLGVLPLHMPYASESAIRRGFGTTLRLVSAASSLVLLARIPTASVISIFTPYLLLLTALAAVYGGWMWLRAPDELTARPYWLIGLASLAMASALRGNPVGATAWNCALLLSGGALFLSSANHIWLNRALWIGMWGISALPFSITATGWGSAIPSFWPVWPFLLLAQALLLAGYLRHAMRPTLRVNFETLDRATQYVYPLGIGILLTTLFSLGLWGWEGAFRAGAWIPALLGASLGGLTTWLAPRLRVLTPLRAHWVRPNATSWIDWSFRGLWGLYRQVGRLSNAFSAIMEGDGGFMWTLLFMVLFITLIIQGNVSP